jgi:hypothetical protein
MSVGPYSRADSRGGWPSASPPSPGPPLPVMLVRNVTQRRIGG